jgi:hypothetical protein
MSFLLKIYLKKIFHDRNTKNFDFFCNSDFATINIITIYFLCIYELIICLILLLERLNNSLNILKNS